MTHAPIAATILLVDDDRVDRMIVRRALVKAGVDAPVVEAKNGREGLALLRSGRVPAPRVVLLDVRMPMMNGDEFLDELRRDPELRDAVVYILTADERLHAAARYAELGAAGFIRKQRAGHDLARLVGASTR